MLETVSVLVGVSVGGVDGSIVPEAEFSSIVPEAEFPCLYNVGRRPEVEADQR